MKILLINKYFYIKGGADSVFFNTSHLLTEHGHQVIPFCIEHPKNQFSEFSNFFVKAPEIRDLNNTFEKIKSIPRFISNKDAAHKIDRLIQQEHPDIAHIHNIFNGISFSILPVLKKYHIPVVITMHDSRFICPSSYFNLRGKLCENCVNTYFVNCIIHQCYQDNFINSTMCAIEMIYKEYIYNYDSYISQYIFVSKRYKNMHSIKHAFFDKKGDLLYNFLPNLKHIVPNPVKGNYLFYYGRVTAEKGIMTLIKVMRKFPHIQLKIAGAGPLFNEAIKLAPKNISFLGFISGKELFDQISNASFIIVPSECEENNPLTIIESYAYGKPVIGSDIGGIPEIIEDGKTGFIFKTFDESSLKDIINKAINISTEEYSNFSHNTRAFAEKHFDGEKHYNTLIGIYNRIISNYENI